MKRITALIVAFIFLTGLAGCNSPQTVLTGSEHTAVIPSTDITQLETAVPTQAANEGRSPAVSDVAETDDVAEGAGASPTAEREEMETPPPTKPTGSKAADTSPTPEKTATPEAVETPPPTEPTGSKAAATSPTPEPAKEENAGASSSSMMLEHMGDLQYYLYTPSDPEADMPLIVYLHGGTNKREDASALLTTDGFPKYLYEGYYEDLRAYVAIPKLDNRYKGWSDISDQIRDLIKVLHTDHFIDMDKISLTGHSMGGTGTYQLQIKLSNTFACIAPMSGSIQNSEENVTALSKTKVWAFVGTEDTIVSPDSSRAVIKALKEAGASAKITELDGATHFDVPSLAYKDDALIQWLVDCGE